MLDSLTLNLGVRNETFENSNLLGEVYVETKDQVAPRLGFSWDPFSNGNSRVYGSYGHYYLPIATNTNMRLAGQEIYFQEYFEGFDADLDGPRTWVRTITRYGRRCWDSFLLRRWHPAVRGSDQGDGSRSPVPVRMDPGRRAHLRRRVDGRHPLRQP